jgi:serine/threonine protein phosphatase PrpC
MNLLRRLIGGQSSSPTAVSKAQNKPDAPAAASSTSDTSPAVELPELDDTVPMGNEREQPSDNSDDAFDFPSEPAATKPLDPDSIADLNLDGIGRELTPQADTLEIQSHLIYGVASHIGAVRSSNQDAAYAFFSAGRSADDIPDFGLFIVADGMGGHHDGEKASALVIRTISSYVLKHIFLPMLSGDSAGQSPISELLIKAVEKANADLNSKVPEGGTTLSSCIVIAGMAHIAHVGDSRIYLIHRNHIEQMTRDHSLVQRLIELDQLTPEEAKEHPQHNVLYRALGQNEAVEVDTLTRRLPPGSRLLLCSDGLWNLVPDQEILDVVLQSRSPVEACNQLIKLAVHRGGQDNITVVLLQMPS